MPTSFEGRIRRSFHTCEIDTEDVEVASASAASDLTWPSVSVIVPVYDDPQGLVQCLERLEAQTYPRALYEVLVIDNGSRAPVDHLVRRFHQATLLSEPRGGQFSARNMGVARSTGAVLAFTDADCLPAPDWLETGVRALLEMPNCAQVGGSVEVYPHDRRRPTAVETYEVIRAFPQQEYIELEHYAVTANMFTFRWAYELVGPFDERMFSGGDNEWGKRLHDRGLVQVYCGAARVRHPARRSFRGLYRKIRRTAIGHRYLNAIRQGKAYSPSRFLYDLRLPVKEILRALADPRLPGVKAKLQYISVATFVRLARAWARFRLELGAGQIGRKWTPNENG
jgi:cellulose synthase/poly-beta-1,6-N-acetylglucosamine synthase-like glycosyltransferase